MRKVVIATALMALTIGAAAQQAPVPAGPDASPDETPLRIVQQAYERVREQQDHAPPPSSLTEQLLRLQAYDQAGRRAAANIDLTKLPAAEAQAARDAIWKEITRHDLENQEKLKTLIPKDGWFKISAVGQRAATAAFLIVQHAVNDPPLMRGVLSKLEEYVRIGEADGQSYALLYDRVALEFDNKPQRYGSQLKCIDGVMTPHNLEEPATVDQRRASIGLKQTMREYLTLFPSSCR